MGSTSHFEATSLAIVSPSGQRIEQIKGLLVANLLTNKHYLEEKYRDQSVDPGAYTNGSHPAVGLRQQRLRQCHGLCLPSRWQQPGPANPFADPGPDYKRLVILALPGPGASTPGAPAAGRVGLGSLELEVPVVAHHGGHPGAILLAVRYCLPAEGLAE